jgi:predicted methyltransferase
VRRPITDLLPPTVLCILLALVLPGCAITTQRPEEGPVPSGSPTPTASVASVQQEPPDAIDRPTDKPYTGSLSLFEDPKREEKLQVNRVMDLLGIREGATVADIGAGSGWFRVRAARRVGNDGLVYAVEINSDYLKHIEQRAKRETLANIRPILGKEDNPLLPERSVDAVLLLKTYHAVAQPIRLLKRTREAMRRGALLGIIDRNSKADDHGIDREAVIEEAGRAGFVLVNEYDFVKPDDVDYFLVFRSK